ncbi:MAG TPA: hypothetical protein VGZ47_09240 [Gemmataceae bacterium]|nr:hypothetical protein [Gemmataceae bacterium]
MPDSADQPLVLDLASLPREQIGPFLLLGIDKDADNKEIEAHWAQRLIWARAKQIRTPLEDINWAKEMIQDRDRRLLADILSLNSDTLAGETRQLLQLEKHGALEPEETGWVPLEPPLPELPELLPDQLPDTEEVRAGLEIPDIPLELPAIGRMLEEVANAPLDPWSY